VTPSLAAAPAGKKAGKVRVVFRLPGAKLGLNTGQLPATINGFAAGGTFRYLPLIFG
jgi:hypothetical protein